MGGFASFGAGFSAGSAVLGRAGRFGLACVLAVSLAPSAAWAQAAESSASNQVNEIADAAAPDVVDVAAAFEGLAAGEDYVADELLVMGSADAASLASSDEAEGYSAAGGVDVSMLAEMVGATVGGVICSAGSSSELSVASADATQDVVLFDGDVAVLELPAGCDIASAARTVATAAPGATVQPNYLLDLIDGEEAAELAADGDSGAAAATEASAAVTDLGINPFASLAFAPNDPALQSPSTSWQLSLIGAYSAWSSARVNHAATVAVIDSGVLATHEDLSGALDVEGAYNSCTDTAGIDACEDTVAHGTHVTGAIGAVANNNLGTAGVSYGARVLPIKCTYARDSGYSPTKASTFSVARGIEYALTKDAQVINLSIGSYRDDDKIYSSAVEKAIAANVSVVCAAGNDASTRPYYPADLDGVISVTAVDSTGTVASFSNHNEHKTLAAPGVSVYGLKNGDAASYGTMSGTSMAAPIVSGCLALLRVANPHITAKEAEQALILTAKDAGDAGFDPYYGWGIVQVDQAVKEVTADPTRGFADMAADAWYTSDDDFGYAVSMGFISGYGDGSTFGPYDGITRGQVATILWRMAGQPEATAPAFDDVDYSAYYGSAIAWARSTSVVHGFSGTNDFAPDALVTRQELACMLANYASIVGGVEVASTCAALDALPDAGSVEGWARTSVGWCMDAGILSGVDSGAGERLACPYDSAWRASMACMATALQRDVLEK